MIHHSAAWAALDAHKSEVPHMRELFAGDTERFSRFSLQDCGLLVDYSKHRITRKTMELLCALAREAGLEAQRAAMFEGQHINSTEDRAVLHTALRAPSDARIYV
ncbi:MAG: glucose-6-phosphate isomerase, partial [Desulfovibrionales bacterium]|nr:glucose-6-phosphate isomerase [Desulfovibrionales bacterium]